jgi:large subunit ribosomal protein L4
MPTVALFNQTGKKLKDITLSDAVFGIEPNHQALYDVVKAQQAAMRQGSQKAKTRSEVRGGGRKPWRQKGTGRARQGTIRAPQWRGGGVVFAPTPRDYSKKVNKQIRQLALKSAYSSKVTANVLQVVDKIQMEEFKTKAFVQILNDLKMNGRTLIILDELNDKVMESASNIPGTSVFTWNHASVVDILNADSIVLTQGAVARLEEVLG